MRRILLLSYISRPTMTPYKLYNRKDPLHPRPYLAYSLVPILLLRSKRPTSHTFVHDLVLYIPGLQNLPIGLATIGLVGIHSLLIPHYEILHVYTIVHPGRGEIRLSDYARLRIHSHMLLVAITLLLPLLAPRRIRVLRFFSLLRWLPCRLKESSVYYSASLDCVGSAEMRLLVFGTAASF